jgi:acetyl-CoA carboxylase beta subunit
LILDRPNAVFAGLAARIGFTGAQVSERSTKERLPESFQTPEFQNRAWDGQYPRAKTDRRAA